VALSQLTVPSQTHSLTRPASLAHLTTCTPVLLLPVLPVLPAASAHPHPPSPITQRAVLLVWLSDDSAVPHNVRFTRRRRRWRSWWCGQAGQSGDSAAPHGSVDSAVLPLHLYRSLVFSLS
jgi:hypothetical protein